jgi:ABC-type transport system involved in multi-copper enzyme maturation permease subunit
VDSIALEREEDTFQLLASTSTSYLGILFGKLCHISIFIAASLWLSLPMGGLLALLSGTKSAEILDCYLVILISAVTFVYISLAVSLLFNRVQVAIGLSYLILAFFCIGMLACASLFNVFLLRLFSPFFAILNATGKLWNPNDINGQLLVPFVPFVRLPNFLVVSAIYAPIWGVISAFVGWKGR